MRGGEWGRDLNLGLQTPLGNVFCIRETPGRLLGEGRTSSESSGVETVQSAVGWNLIIRRGLPRQDLKTLPPPLRPNPQGLGLLDLIRRPSFRPRLLFAPLAPVDGRALMADVWRMRRCTLTRASLRDGQAVGGDLSD